MFTGLIDEVGTIDRVADTDAGREFRIRAGYEALVSGESIAVNGACLTVRESGDGWFTAAAIVTTLGRTAIDGWTVGTRVNLERAMRLGDRLGGHLVQGHVDEVGVVREVRRDGDALIIDIDVSADMFASFVPVGSVAVDGVSLTVTGTGDDWFGVALIPHTLEVTTLGRLEPGDRVNLEVDLMAKYVERLMGRLA